MKRNHYILNDITVCSVLSQRRADADRWWRVLDNASDNGTRLAREVQTARVALWLLPPRALEGHSRRDLLCRAAARPGKPHGTRPSNLYHLHTRPGKPFKWSGALAVQAGSWPPCGSGTRLCLCSTLRFSMSHSHSDRFAHLYRAWPAMPQAQC